MPKTFEGADRFLLRTRELGVLDVRRTEGSSFVLIFVEPDLGSARLDDIRVLARAQWPEASVALAPRVSIRQTGTFARLLFDEDPDAADSKTG